MEINNTLLEPEPKYILEEKNKLVILFHSFTRLITRTYVEKFDNSGIPKIKIWLVFFELMQIKLFTFVVPFPCGAIVHAQLR